MLDNEDLADAAYVFVGVVGLNSAFCSCVREYLTKYKVPALFYGTSHELNNKPLQTVLMHNAGVKQIKTIISKCSAVTVEHLVTELKLPLVSKVIDGSQGRGVDKHDDKATLTKLLKSKKNELYIFQEFIPNDGDIRAFYIGDELVYTIKRRTKDSSKEFRNNISLGGSHEKVKLDAVAIKLASKAQKALAFDMTGLDLIQHQETKDWYVMEVNSAPQFAGGEKDEILQKLVKLIKGVKR
jgi:RimK family alpha-L-glutamate ligase